MWNQTNNLKDITCLNLVIFLNLKDLFKNSKPEEILSFLKEINLFIKI